jgi:hypothetical protein
LSASVFICWLLIIESLSISFFESGSIIIGFHPENSPFLNFSARKDLIAKTPKGARIHASETK